MAERFAELQFWVANALHLRAVKLEPAAADASFRRYFRVYRPGESFIVMDAPPEHEDCRPFVRIAALLRNAGVHAPDVLAQDFGRGFLLLTDLGRQSYLDVLTTSNAETLFDEAMAALIRWQRASRPGLLPPYDRTVLHCELQLFPEWYVTRHCGVTLTTAEQTSLGSIFSLLEGSALAQPRVFVHRDYMPRNLMVSEPNPGVLDFQDALYGPITYDVTTLFKDAFISWDEERIRSWRRQYCERALDAGLPVPEFTEFERACDWMGLQRHLKVLGIFARLWHRDGKRGYLEDMPRFLRYVRETGRRYREFTPLLRTLDAIEERTQKGVTVS